MNRVQSLRPFFVTLVGLGALAIFLGWLISVVLPVTLVELRYQMKHLLHEGLGISDVRSLVSPRFRINLSQVQSAHPEGSIVIPSLYIDERIIFNVNPNNKDEYMKALTNGIAHASGTSLPGSGKLGYYFAHSSTPSFFQQYNAVFYLIHKLEVGDTLYLFHNQNRFDFEVYAKQITAANDTAFLRYNNPKETIVLQTCWPPGTTAQRLLVFAKRTE